MNAFLVLVISKLFKQYTPYIAAIIGFLSTGVIIYIYIRSLEAAILY